MKPTMLCVNDVSISYGSRNVLKNVTFEVKANQTFVRTGRNGCGKSTLLKLLTGITLPSNGKLEWASELDNKQIGYAADRFPKL